jgi:hypothetical protein
MPSTYTRSLYGTVTNVYLAHLTSILILANEGLGQDIFDVICDGGPFTVSGDAPGIDVRSIPEGKTVDAPDPIPEAHRAPPGVRYDPWTLVLRSKLLSIDSFAIVLHPDERIETSLSIPPRPDLPNGLTLGNAVRKGLDDIELLHSLFHQIAVLTGKILLGEKPPTYIAQMLAILFLVPPELDHTSATTSATASTEPPPTLPEAGALDETNRSV